MQCNCTEGLHFSAFHCVISECSLVDHLVNISISLPDSQIALLVLCNTPYLTFHLMLDIGGEWNTPSDSVKPFLLDNGAL